MKKKTVLALLIIGMACILAACIPIPRRVSSSEETTSERVSSSKEATTKEAAKESTTEKEIGSSTEYTSEDTTRSTDYWQETFAAAAEGTFIWAEDYDYLDDGRQTGGYGEGLIGDTFVTQWFDFTVDSVALASQYETYIPQAGYMLLIADITITNTYDDILPMYLDDFQVQWGSDAPDAYGYGIESLNAEMMPDYYELEIRDSITYTIVFEVPETNSGNYSISFQEYYADDTMGNLYFVLFKGSALV